MCLECGLLDKAVYLKCWYSSVALDSILEVYLNHSRLDKVVYLNAFVFIVGGIRVFKISTF